MLGFLLLVVILLAVIPVFIGAKYYDFRRYTKGYADAIEYARKNAGVDFQPDYLLKTSILKVPVFGIDSEKKLFYIYGRKSCGIFHASEVTNISLDQRPSGNAFKTFLTLTVKDLDEPKRYVIFGNMIEAETWFGRVQAVWNS
ncbi:Uncharacterised protein [Moraxella caprae]|uniref:Uncharacterized protein n=1 Tax=Moraxella caprae TaxID=90240 RepID=A0A378R0F1_9GAMM|nr:hypothetical protein [Moraxella caprae]STZ07300.1 Uncharacterised protein [Moraxella caprae]